MKLFVVSGVNIVEAGALSVYYDFLDHLVQSNVSSQYHIISFVHNHDLFRKYENQIEIIELPKAKRNYVYRIWYEYIYFKRFSKTRIIDKWFSIHDITPNVNAKEQYVYCHNASPFLNAKISLLLNNWKLFMFSKFYKYLYRINIHRNKYVIVQQNWLRKEFKSLYGINNVVVARPDKEYSCVFNNNSSQSASVERNMFFYPAYPREFKNFEVICSACEIMESRGYNDFKVYLTLNGSENRYSKRLVNKYKHNTCIVFLGVIEKEEVISYYAKSQCLLFPSKLESWGLPIIEFKATSKPMIIADLPYAHETVGDYSFVKFFNPDSSEELASAMVSLLNSECEFTTAHSLPIEQPYCRNWSELIKLIMNNPNY